MKMSIARPKNGRLNDNKLSILEKATIGTALVGALAIAGASQTEGKMKEYLQTAGLYMFLGGCLGSMGLSYAKYNDGGKK